jgi:septum site-determining protein MinD
MAGYVCTIAGGKGGVGKTTTAINVAAALEGDVDTIIVDADLGMANLAEMLSLEYDTSLHEILAGDAPVSDGLTEAEDGLTAIPGEQSLEAFAEADPAKLRKVIKALRNAYDLVLVDTGAGLSHETTVPLGLADGVLLVTTPNDVAVSDTIKTAELADRVDGDVIGVVIDRATENTDVDAIDERVGFPLLGVVPNDLSATDEEPMVFNAPDSPAADAYKRLAEQLNRIFFEGVDGAEIAEQDAVFDPEWFADEEDEDEDDDSGGFSLFG